VYPVPDGDTGTNMLHTIRSAVVAARRADPRSADRAAAAAYGALMGARGNSGVILSQIFAGAKEAFAGRDDVGGPELANALAQGRDLAYQAVSTPVEGTILTAIHEMAKAANTGATEDAVAVLDRAMVAGRAAVARTPELLPVLKQAGVVDAGAQGLLYVVEGMADLVAGRVSVVERSADEEAAIVADADHALPASSGGTWGYDVQFLVPSPSRGVRELREEMLRFGLDDPGLSCVLVVGDDLLVKVHVHTREPHEILRIGLSAGRVRDVVVEDLDAMVAAQERATGVTVSATDVERRPLAVVSVVAAEGLADVARSLGATPLRGGKTANPSVEEILRAIEAVPGDAVIVLPNDKDITPAAERAAHEAKKPARVIPTRSIPQGVAALVAFDAQGELDAVANAMAEAARRARTLEVTRAGRTTTVDGVKVREGDYMALLDGKCVGAAPTSEEALRLGAKAVGRAELCTVYLGAGVDGDHRQSASAVLQAACGCQVEVVEGGQPHYPYIVSAE